MFHLQVKQLKNFPSLLALSHLPLIWCGDIVSEAQNVKYSCNSSTSQVISTGSQKHHVVSSYWISSLSRELFKTAGFSIVSMLAEHPDRIERSGLGTKPHFSISYCVKAASKASRRLMCFHKCSFLPLQCCVDNLFRLADNVKDFKGSCRHSHLASWIQLGVKVISSLQWGN